MTAPQVTPIRIRHDRSDRPWVTIVWNDPINLMSYVTWVFQKLFGYSREKVEKSMLDAPRASGGCQRRPCERMEYHAAQLHGHGLWATVDRP